ncbi:MAG: hypothetical protein KA230_06435 [Flavobacteriales bacterium]|nr:hypothetical protein [Flavobacteriales bacterium]
MKATLLPFLVLVAVHCSGQVSIDKPIELSGSNAERHVAGIPVGTSTEHALRAGTLQSGSYAFAPAVGSNALSISLTPAVSLPIAGMNLMVSISAVNTAAVTITVDGNGPYPIQKNAVDDLAAGDLLPGMVASLVFDGTVFHLTNARRLERRACPSGFTQVNELYCIEPVSRDTVYMDSAAVICGNLDARLCTWGEWYYACTQAGNLALLNMGNQWEWTNSTANGVGSARVVGATSCTHAGVGPAYDTLARKFRCCYDR